MGQGRHKEENITKRQTEVMQEICRFFSTYGKMPKMQELADAFGASAPTIYDILQELISKGYLKRIEKGATKPYVIKKAVEPEALVTVQIPLLGEIPGGVPVEEFEDRSGDETVSVDKALTTNGEVFALRVKGDSMIGADIKTGDIVIIRHQPIAADGDIVAASVNNEVTLKRLVNRPDRIALEAENPEFKPIELTRYDSFRVIGKMVGIIKQEADNNGGSNLRKFKNPEVLRKFSFQRLLEMVSRYKGYFDRMQFQIDGATEETFDYDGLAAILSNQMFVDEYEELFNGFALVGATSMECFNDVLRTFIARSPYAGELTDTMSTADMALLVYLHNPEELSVLETDYAALKKKSFTMRATRRDIRNLVITPAQLLNFRRRYESDFSGEELRKHSSCDSDGERQPRTRAACPARRLLPPARHRHGRQKVQDHRFSAGELQHFEHQQRYRRIAARHSHQSQVDGGCLLQTTWQKPLR